MLMNNIERFDAHEVLPHGAGLHPMPPSSRAPVWGRMFNAEVGEGVKNV